MENNSALTNICKLFDSYFIAEKQNQLNKQYVASSDNIVSDGKFNHRINKDGYIIIDNVDENTNYLIFIDKSGDLFLAIYQYTPAYKFKDISDIVNDFKKPRLSETLLDGESTIEVDNDMDYAKLIDVNEFTHCPKCNHNLSIPKSKNDASVIFSCSNCRCEYTLVPSKYYVLKSIRQFFTSENNVKIKQQE